MRAELAARARARGAARHANGSGGLKAQLKQAKAATRDMAGLLLQARTAGQHVASALTDAKARGVYATVCGAEAAMPAEQSARIRDIADAVASLDAADRAQHILEQEPAVEAAAEAPPL